MAGVGLSAAHGGRTVKAHRLKVAALRAYGRIGKVCNLRCLRSRSLCTYCRTAEHHFIREMRWVLVQLGAFPIFSNNSYILKFFGEKRRVSVPILHQAICHSV